jgi:hypothetical protein
MHICNNTSCHNPLHCFLPPYVIDRLAESDDPEIRPKKRKIEISYYLLFKKSLNE